MLVTVKKEMPKFMKKPDPLEVMEHDDSVFVAQVYGKPTPKVEWCRADKVLEEGDKHEYTIEGMTYTLKIKDTLKEEAGMITVKAKNDSGTMSASARLKVTRTYNILYTLVICLIILSVPLSVHIRSTCT